MKLKYILKLVNFAVCNQNIKTTYCFFEFMDLRTFDERFYYINIYRNFTYMYVTKGILLMI